jgi:hypothetical protein
MNSLKLAIALLVVAVFSGCGGDSIKKNEENGKKYAQKECECRSFADNSKEKEKCKKEQEDLFASFGIDKDGPKDGNKAFDKEFGKEITECLKSEQAQKDSKKEEIKTQDQDPEGSVFVDEKSGEIIILAPGAQYYKASADKKAIKLIDTYEGNGDCFALKFPNDNKVYSVCATPPQHPSEKEKVYVRNPDGTDQIFIKK